MSIINKSHILKYHRDGAIFIPNLFRDWIEIIKEGIDFNINNPGIYAAENTKNNESGRFFDDYCNWQRISEFKRVIYESHASSVAAKLMGSKKVQFFHDHVLYKSSGTDTPTPWHQDGPYYFVKGAMTVSFWIPIDPVPINSSLRIIKGSHNWGKEVMPIKWLSGDNFYNDNSKYAPIPDPDKDPAKYSTLEWEMKPGDAIAFHFNAVHGARGNPTNDKRRVLSLRFIGDDAKFIQRQGKTSPPFPNHNMKDGQKLREDWFPFI